MSARISGTNWPASGAALAARLGHGALGDALAGLAGALTVLAFAPFSAWPLAVLTLAALFLLLNGQSAGRAAWRGFLFGFFEFLFGVYWIYISIHIVGGAPVLMAIGMLVGLVAVMGAYAALACGLAVRLAPRPGPVRWLLALPALWVLIEWLRGWLLTGFSWLSLGYSQIDGPLKGYAPVLGVYGVSLAVALSAGLLVILIQGTGKAPRLGSLAGLGALWLIGGVLAGIAWTRPAAPAMTVSLIQGDIPQSIKWQPEALEPTLRLYRKLTDEHWASRLIVWPEAAIPDYLDDVPDFAAQLQADAERHGADLLVGVPTEDDAGHYYNSVVSFGKRPGEYHKHHLVPFGENFTFLPRWVRYLLRDLELPYSSFTPGAARQKLLRAAGYPVGVSICYEDAYGNEIMRALPKAAFLVNVSDDGWFGDSIALPQHLEIARMRALEAGRYLLRATNTGITAIIGPHGGVRASLAPGLRGVLDGEFVPYRGATPYARLGNGAIVVLCALMAAGGYLRRLRRDRASG